MSKLVCVLMFCVTLGLGCSSDQAMTRDAAATDSAVDANTDECSADVDCAAGRCQADNSCACPFAGDVPAPAPWTRQAGSPLLVPGQTHSDGTNYLLADPSAIYDDGGWKLWYAASRGSCFSCENDPVIEHAHSTDGVSWTVQEEVALGLSGVGWDAIRTETPDVVVVPTAAAERRYVMAYSGADVTLPLGFPNYNIGIAFSANGETFSRVAASESPLGQDGLVLTELDVFPAAMGVSGGVVADPTLVFVDNTYHMWFSSFACGDGDTCADILNFGVSHATSVDAVNWTADPGNPVIVGAEQPSVVWNSQDCQFEMYFTRDAPGEEDAVPSVFSVSLGTFRAVSPDGSTWTVDAQRDFDWDGTSPGEELGLMTGVDVAMRDNERVLFYVGMGTQLVPSGSLIPVQTSFDAAGFVPGTFGLGIAEQ